jgi:RNA polymerase sigma-70 factor, ECF subfamily
MARAGRREDELAKRYYESVFRFFKGRGFHRQDAADLTQETFIRVFKHVGELRDEAAIATWIRRIAVNVWKNELRFRHAARRAGAEVPVDAADAMAAGTLERELAEKGPRSPDALVELLDSEKAAVMHRCLGGLPPRMRQCLLMHIDEGHKYREVADQLGLSIESVKSHIHQARARLTACVERTLGRGWR